MYGKIEKISVTNLKVIRDIDMGFIDYFIDWQKKENVLVYRKTHTVDSAQRPVENTSVLTTLDKIAIWVTSSQVSDANDKFEGERVGKIMTEAPNVTIDTDCYFLVDNKEYWVAGIDDTAFFGEIYIYNFKATVD